jgi:putative ABC transport system permease protein
MGIFLAIQGAASQGVLWGLMTLGLFITYKILNFADLTVDGSFALGGSVSAILITSGFSPYLSLVIAFFAGSLAGLVTGLLHTKLKIPGILTGILTMIALYSVNIRVMGQANIPLLGQETMLTLTSSFGLSKTLGSLLIGSIFSAIVIAILYWFFGTELGSAIRATGSNEKMVQALGINTESMKKEN